MHRWYGSLIHEVAEYSMTFVYFVHEEVVGFTCVFLMQEGVTPLYLASDGEVVELLLSSGADINKVEHCNVSMQCSTTSQATMWIAL